LRKVTVRLLREGERAGGAGGAGVSPHY